jgi:hypothetical protein
MAACARSLVPLWGAGMHASVRWTRRDLLAVLVLALGVSLFHARGLAPRQTFLPVDLTYRNLPWMSETATLAQNWLVSDPFYQFYPFLDRTVKSIRELDWLLWNPYIFAGHPSFADPLFQTFYPLVQHVGSPLASGCKWSWLQC